MLYTYLFCDNPKNQRQTHLMEHRIITEWALPVKQKVRRIPAAWEDEVHTQVTEMLKNYIIRPSVSPWNSPLHLVKKEDTYPLPTLEMLSIRCMVQRTGRPSTRRPPIRRCPLVKRTRRKRILASRGKYELHVTPYGLSNAGASYQRVIDMCLPAGLPANQVLAYMDVIVLYSPNFEEHSKDLDTVFGHLRVANISIKATKCMIAMRKVDFLGYELSGEGIRLQNRLKEAIQEFHRPEPKKELKSFLVLAGFHRYSIRDFAEISHPLKILMRECAV